MSKSEKSILSSNYFAAHAIEIGEVLQRAVRDALLMHKRLGNPIATWKDGEVVIVPPEDIVIPPDVSDSKE